MKIVPLDYVECFVLHETNAPLGKTVLIDLLRDAAAAQGIEGDVIETPFEGDGVGVSIGDYFMLVSQHPEALGLGGFLNALEQPATGIMSPGAKGMIDKHVSYSAVRIGKLSYIGSGAGSASAAGAASPHFLNTWEEAKPAMGATYLAVRAISMARPSTLAHWMPSDQVMELPVFQSMVGMKVPMMLYIRPNLFSSSGRLDGKSPMGAVAHGSQHLLGHTVAMEETTAPFGYIMESLSQFIAYCHHLGHVVPHMESFGTSPKEKIGVVHMPLKDGQAFCNIHLRILQSERCNIG